MKHERNIFFRDRSPHVSPILHVWINNAVSIYLRRSLKRFTADSPSRRSLSNVFQLFRCSSRYRPVFVLISRAFFNTACSHWFMHLIMISWHQVECELTKEVEGKYTHKVTYSVPVSPLTLSRSQSTYTHDTISNAALMNLCRWRLFERRLKCNCILYRAELWQFLLHSRPSSLTLLLPVQPVILWSPLDMMVVETRPEFSVISFFFLLPQRHPERYMLQPSCCSP